nr:hypothetical protein [Tissierella sp.]
MKKKLIIGMILFTIFCVSIINVKQDVSYVVENDGEIESNEYVNEKLV